MRGIYKFSKEFFIKCPYPYLSISTDPQGAPSHNQKCLVTTHDFFKLVIQTKKATAKSFHFDHIYSETFAVYITYIECIWLNYAAHIMRAKLVNYISSLNYTFVCVINYFRNIYSFSRLQGEAKYSRKIFSKKRILWEFTAISAL